MQIPLEITFRDMPPSEEIKALVTEKAGHLETFYGGIISCRVVIRAPHKRQQTGNLFEVTIELRVPGDDLVVRHHQHDVAEREHMRVAVRDAFSAMARKLKRWKDAVSGEEKAHEGALQGRVAEIHHDAGYGQIIATDHRLIYFHENSVVDGSFQSLQPRDTVELVVQTEESGIGPQASTVRRIGNLKYDPGPRKP